MKTFFDRLKEMPVKRLQDMIEMQKQEMITMQRDLERMERALREKTEEKVPDSLDNI